MFENELKLNYILPKLNSSFFSTNLAGLGMEGTLMSKFVKQFAKNHKKLFKN